MSTRTSAQGGPWLLIALERGEVDGLFTARQISRPDIVTSGFLIPILQSVEEHPGIPLMSDAVSDSNARALPGLLLAPSRIGLPQRTSYARNGNRGPATPLPYPPKAEFVSSNLAGRAKLRRDYYFLRSATLGYAARNSSS